jgi:coproporphyrinogen III oxidase-like Fe-S oxidoreductase
VSSASHRPSAHVPSFERTASVGDILPNSSHSVDANLTPGRQQYNQYSAIENELGNAGYRQMETRGWAKDSFGAIASVITTAYDQLFIHHSNSGAACSCH